MALWIAVWPAQTGSRQHLDKGQRPGDPVGILPFAVVMAMYNAAAADTVAITPKMIWRRASRSIALLRFALL